MQNVRDTVLARIPAEASAGARLIAEQTVDETLSAFMTLLDSVYPTPIDAEHYIEYVLLARVKTGSHADLETFELAPDGDGLGMGYWGWQQGDFGEHSRSQERQ